MSADIEKQPPPESELQTEVKGNELNADTKEPSAASTDRSSLEQPAPNEAPKPANPWADPSSFPDGGPQAWLTVAAASACFFVSWG